ncbi:MAG TPA: tetratricopeptide repeat protein [Candidatus Acidoferrum sp.]|nr:tetratricopeptide repeat protein [Candidatus Acidoferrum sp.]
MVLAVLASAFAFMGAQTTTSGAVAIHEHLRKAAEYLKANNPNSAVKELDAVLALDPKNAEANANLGVIAFYQRDYQNAAKYLRKALATDPSLAKTQALLAICQERLGDPAARASLEKAFQKLRDKPLRIQVGVELAGLYDREGDLEATAAVMRSLVEIDPENVDILYAAQRAYSELADDTLNKLAIVGPNSARMQQVIAERLINEGDLKTAIEHYRKALEINPRLPGVRFELAEAILESSPDDPKAQAEAEKELETAVKFDGDNAKTECLFGRIAFRRNELDSSYAHYERAFALNPREVEAQVGLGRVLMVAEKPQEALKYLRMAVQSDPLNGEAHYRLATVCRKLQLKDEAEKEFWLSKEIKQTKEQVEGLYRQMSKKPKAEEEQIPDAAP